MFYVKWFVLDCVSVRQFFILLCSCTSLRIIDSHQGGPASQKDFDPSTDAVSVTFAVLFLLLFCFCSCLEETENRFRFLFL